MSLLSGLEQFGINVGLGMDEIFGEEKRRREKAKQPPKEDTAEKEHPETEFLFKKRIRCAVCDQTFESITVKNARLKRLQPDFDLRPRFQYIDTLKYGVDSCPYCGYTALSNYFDHLTNHQIRLVKQEVCEKFQPVMEETGDTRDYEAAIIRHKLALFNSMAKKAKTSEKAYTCLKLSWLYRSRGDEMPEETAEEKKEKAECRRLQEEFYKEAYEGFKEAIATEDFPICGMDASTVDYLMACLATHFKEYSYASKAVSNILTSKTVNKRIKDRAYDLKQAIIADMKKDAENKRQANAAEAK